MMLMTIPKAARHFNTTTTMINRLMEAGIAHVLMVGARRMVDIAELDRFFSVMVDIGVIGQRTGLSVGAIRRCIDEGWLPAVMICGKYWFDPGQVDSAIAARMKNN